MKMYGEALAKHSIDSSKLLSGDFTETFVEKTLGVSNKMHSKKLANAARKLQVPSLPRAHAHTHTHVPVDVNFRIYRVHNNRGTSKSLRQAWSLIRAKMRGP